MKLKLFILNFWIALTLVWFALKTSNNTPWVSEIETTDGNENIRYDTESNKGSINNTLHTTKDENRLAESFVIEDEDTNITSREVNKELELFTGPSNTVIKKTKFILVLAIAGRSGSTMFSELLATEENSVLFFEPLFYSYVSGNNLNLENGSSVAKFLEDIFNCRFSKEFENWFRHKDLFRSYFHPSIRKCKKPNLEKCIQDFDFRGLCKNAVVRIIKVIRSPLIFSSDLLKHFGTELKVIYLQREPRALLAANRKMHWPSDPTSSCQQMLRNNKVFIELSQKYPYSIDQLQLEELCREPLQLAQRIYTFLYNTSTLSEAFRNYIQTHMKTNGTSRSNMSTNQNSKREYQAWRWEIGEKYFAEIEKNPFCRIVIQNYGHRLFGSTDKLRDSNVSLEIK